MRRTSSWCRIYQHNEKGWQDRRQVLCGEAFLGSGKRCDRPCKSWESIAITVCFAVTNLLDIPWVRLGVLRRSNPTVKRWREQRNPVQRFHDYAIKIRDRQWAQRTTATFEDLPTFCPAKYMVPVLTGSCNDPDSCALQARSLSLEEMETEALGIGSKHGCVIWIKDHDHTYDMPLKATHVPCWKLRAVARYERIRNFCNAIQMP